VLQLDKLRFQLPVTRFAFLQRAPLLKQALLQVANPVAQVDRHRAGRGRLVRGSTLGIDSALRLAGQLEQIGQVLDLAAGSVARIGDESLLPDFAEAKKFLDRTYRGGAVIALARHFHEPIHSQLGKHRRFEPGSLIVRELVVGRNLRGRRPTSHLLEGNGPKTLPSSCLLRTNAGSLSSPLFVRRGRAGGGGGRAAGRAGNNERLSDLQFSVVLDVIEFLQLVDADFVHLRDGGERLAPNDDVRGAARSWRRERRRRFARRRKRAARQDRFGMFDLLLQPQNLLGESVDLGVLFVDLSTQGRKFRIFGILDGTAGTLGTRVDHEEGAQKEERESAAKANHAASLASPSDAGKLAAGCVLTH
jgi:hypothetical protein